jgi:TfoX/Sxy family transcriptional regulator of competence genes
MKYYSETADHDLRLAFEAEVRIWTKVTARKMFGCPCYQANGKLFALVVSGGIVITHTSASDREILIQQFLAVPFQPGQSNVQAWLRVPAQFRTEIVKLLPYLHKSYEAALAIQEG